MGNAHSDESSAFLAKDHRRGSDSSSLDDEENNLNKNNVGCDVGGDSSSYGSSGVGGNNNDNANDDDMKKNNKNDNKQVTYGSLNNNDSADPIEMTVPISGGGPGGIVNDDDAYDNGVLGFFNNNNNNSNYDTSSLLGYNSNHGTTGSMTSAGDDFYDVELCFGIVCKVPSIRRIALRCSLWVNIIICLAKLVAYIQTFSLSVLAALLDAVLDVVSQMVLNYTEKHSSMQRSSAQYPAGASRLEPIGVLTCAALMGMASFEVLKESITSLIYNKSTIHGGTPTSDTNGVETDETPSMASFWNLVSIIIAKLFLLWLCNVGANKRVTYVEKDITASRRSTYMKAVVQLADPTLEALAQDHFNDILSNGVAAFALLFALRSPSLWFLDPVGAILISIYIIWSWYCTGAEQIEHLTGKVAPDDFLDEIKELADCYDERMIVDVVRAYHFGPKFLVEIEVVMPKETLLFESHDLGMELQYEIESREEVERCFVHIDYETRPYDEHVVSKVPELREKYRPKKVLSSQSV